MSQVAGNRVDVVDIMDIFNKMKILVSENWEIGPIAYVIPISTYWNSCYLVQTCGNHEFIAKLRQGEKCTDQEVEVLQSIKGQVPVAFPIATRTGNYFAPLDDKIVSLYEKLEGESFRDHFNDEKKPENELLGESIGRLHTGLEHCEPPTGITLFDPVRDIENWVVPSLDGAKETLPATQILKTAENTAESLRKQKGNMVSHLIHRDLHPQNMLFKNNRLTGILDFDMVTFGPRIFDPCYCSSSIFTSAFKDAAKMEKWETIHKLVFKGYRSHIDLSPEELEAIPDIFILIQLLFLGFSIYQKDMEAAQFNWDIICWARENIDGGFIL